MPANPRAEWRKKMKAPWHSSVDWRVYHVHKFRDVTVEMVTASLHESINTMRRSITNPDEVVVPYDIRDGEPPDSREGKVYYHDEMLDLFGTKHWAEPES